MSYYIDPKYIRPTSSTTKKPKKKKEDLPWYKDVAKYGLTALEQISRPYYASMGVLNEMTDGEGGFFEPVDRLKAAYRGFTLKDKKTSDDLLNNLGWVERPKYTEAERKELEKIPRYSLEGLMKRPDSPLRWFDARKGQLDFRDFLEFGTDTALDPLTYVTFGGSASLGKAGEKAAYQALKSDPRFADELGRNLTAEGQRKAIERVAQKQYDDTIAKNIDSLVSGGDRQVSTRVSPDGDEYVVDEGLRMVDGQKVDPTLNPRLVQKLAEKRKQDVLNTAENASKAARVKQQNALISLDVPFFNIVAQIPKIGKKPKWATVKDPTIGTAQVAALERMMNEAGATPEQIKILRSGKATDEQIADIMNKVGFTDQQKLDFINEVSEGKGIENLTRQEYDQAVERVKQARLRQLDRVGQTQTVRKTEVDRSEEYLADVAEQMKTLMNTTYAKEMENLKATNPGKTDDEIIQDIIQKEYLPRKTGEILSLDTPTPMKKIVRKKPFSKLKSVPKEIRSLMEDVSYKLSVMGKPDDIVFDKEFLDNIKQVSKIKKSKSPATMLERIKQAEAKKMQLVEDLKIFNEILDEDVMKFAASNIRKTPTYKNIIDDLQRNLRNPAKYVRTGVYSVANPHGVRLSELKNAREVVDVVDSQAVQLPKNNRFTNLDTSPIQIDAGGVSPLGAKLSRLDPTNARTFRSTDENVNAMATDKRMAQNAVLAGNRQLEKVLLEIQDASKGLTDEQKQAVQFLLEKRLPDSYVDNMIESAGGTTTLKGLTVQIQELENDLAALKQNKSKAKDHKAKIDAVKVQIADLKKQQVEIRGKNKMSYQDMLLAVSNGNKESAKQLEKVVGLHEQAYRKIAREELDAGSLLDTRENYYPHVVERSPEEIKQLEDAYKNDPEIGALIRQAAGNRFAKERKTYQTMAEVDNQLAGMQERLRDLDEGSEEFLELDKKINVLSKLYERDPFTALAKRYRKGVKAAAMKRLQNTLYDNGFLYRPNEKPADTTNFKRLNEDEARALGLPDKSYVHKEILEGLKQTNEVFTSKGMNRLFRYLEAATNMFKTVTTTIIPSHHVYNMIGLAYNNSMAGVAPSAYKKASDLLTKLKDGKLTADEEKLLDTMERYGVLNQTSYADMLPSDINQLETEMADNWFFKTEKFVTDNPVTRFFRSISDGIDNSYRVAHYLDVLGKTKNHKMAADSVKKYLFNYSELTRFDRAMKVPFPFWNWMKNNIPLQIHNLLTSPRFALAYMKLREQNMEGSMDDPNIPPWVKQSYMRFGDTFYNPRPPVQDVEGVTDGGKLLGSLNPAFKMPAELIANQEFFTGKPIDYDKKFGKRENISAKNFGKYLLSQTGASNRAKNVVQDFNVDKPWYEEVGNALGTVGVGSTPTLEQMEEKAKQRGGKKKKRQSGNTFDPALLDALIRSY